MRNIILSRGDDHGRADEARHGRGVHPVAADPKRFLRLSIDQVIIGDLSLARFRMFSLCPKAFYIPSPAQHAELPKLSPPNIFARSGSRDEPPMTACGGNLIGGEISRNEQSRHEGELRRLRLRTLSTLVGCGAKPQRNPLVQTNQVN